MSLMIKNNKNFFYLISLLFLLRFKVFFKKLIQIQRILSVEKLRGLPFVELVEPRHGEPAFSIASGWRFIDLQQASGCRGAGGRRDR